MIAVRTKLRSARPLQRIGRGDKHRRRQERVSEPLSSSSDTSSPSPPLTPARCNNTAEPERLIEKRKLPRFLYARLSRGQMPTFKGLSGKSEPSVVYALRSKNCQYRIRLTFNWKENVTILDETESDKHQAFATAAKTYDGLVRMLGVKKNREAWRIFDTSQITSVFDTRTKRELLKETNELSEAEEQVLYSEPRRQIVNLDENPLPYSEKIAHRLYDYFGSDNYDWSKDYIDVAAVARRLRVDADLLTNKMTRVFTDCRLFSQSGCWLSPKLYTYRTVASWKYDGFSSEDLFSHNGEGLERHVVRHHPLRCELFVITNHGRCCRPSHLCYGSVKANTRDMQLRQAVSNLLTLFAHRDTRLKLVEIVDVCGALLAETCVDDANTANPPL